MWHLLKEKIIILSFLFICFNVVYAFPVFSVEGSGVGSRGVEVSLPGSSEGSSAGGGEKKSFLDISGNVLFWNLLTFAILVFVLGKYGWKPIVSALDERASRIKEDIDRANRDREAGEKLLLEKKGLMAKAYSDSQEIISRAKEEAKKASGEILDDARKEAQIVIEKARNEIDQARNKALFELKEELGIISLDIASKVISKNFSLDEHRSLILDMLSMYENKN